MEYESRKKLDVWTFEHMKRVFEALEVIKDNPDFQTLEEKYREKARNTVDFKNPFYNLSWSSYKSYIEVCEVLIARMKKESERVKKQKKPIDWSRRN